ncbi:hypothetical protein [Dolosigranulum pigrum]|uniref:Uncharacterized protein n=1 Tax=Dolosigranulum pigrum TaxID=29394 RepID=A0A516GGL7_9LACT|nr:hypothetical protein [Dolosigranulum pigrum]QDO90657.1 hypothetical protein FNV33_00760 [Dolosigranulum pigrum]
MSQRIKYTLYTLLGGLITFPTAIMLTSHFTAAQKGMLHGTLSLILFGLIVYLWCSFKPFTWQKAGLTLLWLAAFIWGLPLAIELVAFLPTVLKGILHAAVIVLFIVLFVMIWYKPLKSAQ